MNPSEQPFKAAAFDLPVSDQSDPREGDLVCAHGRRPWTELKAVPPLSADDQQRAGVFADARLLLWTAYVRRTGAEYAWELSVAPEWLQSPLLRLTAYRRHGYFWHPSYAPDYAKTELTYREALARGADRYRQQFRILHQGRTAWLDEVVRIARLGPNEWQLAGLIRDVTEQKVAEQAEHRVTAELQRLLQHAQCMLWHGSVAEQPDGTLGWQMTFLPSGLQRRIFEHAVGTMTTGLYEPFDVPQIEEMHARSHEALRSGAPGYQQEFVLTRRRDNQTFWLREHVAIVRRGPGCWELSGVMIDVTAEKMAEIARRDTELHFRHLLEQVDCIVWHAELTPEPGGNHHWTITAPPSRLYRRLFNREPVGPLRLWTPEATPEYARMDRCWREALASGASEYEQEFRYVAQRRVTWLQEKVTVLQREGGTIRLVGVVVDITERKLAELQLNAEKERLAVTLLAMDEAVATVDLKGAITFLNRAAESLLQVTAEDALGRPFGAIATLEVGQPPQPTAWPLGEPASINLPAHAQLVRPRGPALRIEGCIAALRDPASRPTGAVIVLRDVTERHVLQTQLQRASTLESVGILAGGIAHDFNNILTALLANLSLAELDLEPGTELAGYLREARAATDRAAALARQLLTFAKGGDPLLAAVNLTDVIEEVTRFTLRGTQIDHALDLAADLWPAHADRAQLAQIIQNLVLNAAQSMPNGGTIRITARNETIGPEPGGALPPGPYLHLLVADTGAGIAPDALDKVFTPYFTTKSSGHGLGLAVVYSIVKKHRGSINVQSTAGRGTTFELRLPAEPAGIIPRPGTTPPRRLSLRGRVLIMDDEESILTVLSAYFRQLGLEVETASDGVQAVSAYTAARERGAPFDVVITDLTVPGKMGGREAIAALRKIDPAVSAIVASGYSNDPVLANYQDFGFAAMAAKPYDITLLVQQVGELIRRRRATDQ